MVIVIRQKDDIQIKYYVCRIPTVKFLWCGINAVLLPNTTCMLPQKVHCIIAWMMHKLTLHHHTVLSGFDGSVVGLGRNVIQTINNISYGGKVSCHQHVHITTDVEASLEFCHSMNDKYLDPHKNFYFLKKLSLVSSFWTSRG